MFLRRLLFPLRLARARLLGRPGRAALILVGVAAGAAMLAAVLAGSLVARDRAVARSLAGVAPEGRTLRATWLGVPGQGSPSWPALDRAARHALRPLAGRRPTAVLLYRESRIGDALVDLGAVEGLGRFVRLSSGRLPRTCRPSRCEVVQLGGSGPRPHLAGLRLVLVGRGSLASAVPFGSFIEPGAYSPVVRRARGYHTAAPPPLLVTEGVAALSRAPDLQSVYRSYAWVDPVAPGSVHPWEIGRFASRLGRARSSLQARSAFFDLTGPIDAVQVAGDSSAVSARRLLLVGGEAAALLLAFAVFAAASVRQEVEAARRRLTWQGARRWQLLLLFAAEAAAVAAAGTLVGWLVGAGAAAAIADRAGSPAAGVLRHSLVSGAGILAAVGLAAAAALGLLLAHAARPLKLGSLAVSAVDVAALGALAAIVLAFARGRADQASLAAQRGTGVLLLLLPGLVVFVAAVVCARTLVPALRLLERLARGGPPTARLAALSLARHPGRSAAAVAFLAVSVGLALFAAIYRSTLAANQTDEAAYSVPLDFVAQTDFSQLVYPFEAASLDRYRALAGGAEVLPVLRLPVDIEGVQGESPTLLGVPAAALPTLHGWRSDFAAAPLAELARRIAPAHPVALRSVALPPGATELSLPVAARGDDVKVEAELETPDRDFREVTLGATRGPTRRVLRARIPTEARGGRLVGFRLALVSVGNPDASAQVARGVLTVGTPSAGGTQLPVDYGSWVGRGGVTATGRGRARYVVSNEVDSRFRPRQPTDGQPVPVIVSSRLARAAGPGGILPVQNVDQQVLTRVVGIARRFPTVEGDLVLADESRLETALNADTPGSAVPQELWLGASSPRRVADLGAALGRAPFDTLTVSSRRGLEASLRGDPLSRASLAILATTAGVALALALVGLLLSVVAALRDERGELLDLEAQGAAPATLRRHLRLRALIVTLGGLAGGLAAGAVLSALVVDLVVLTANATAPEPPLLLRLDWRTLVLGLAAYASIAAVLVGAATWAAFRARVPGRLAEAA